MARYYLLSLYYRLLPKPL